MPHPQKKLGPIEQNLPISVFETFALNAIYVPLPIETFVRSYREYSLVSLSILQFVALPVK
jgi:hypothetical protein